MNASAVKSLISALAGMPAGVEREMVFYRWKHANCPSAGLFSCAHGCDSAGNFLLAMAGEFEWPETAVFEGKTIVLEYERNFNNFVKWAKKNL